MTYLILSIIFVVTLITIALKLKANTSRAADLHFEKKVAQIYKNTERRIEADQEYWSQQNKLNS